MTEGYIKGRFGLNLSCEVNKILTEEELTKIAENVIEMMENFEDFDNIDFEIDADDSFCIEASYELVGKYWSIPATRECPPEGDCEYDIPNFDKLMKQLAEKYKDYKFSINYDESPFDEDILDADYFFDEDAYCD